jgi:hypothetical protein
MAQSPLRTTEEAFVARVLFETLRFAEDIERSAEPSLRELRLDNGAIENFIRVLEVCSYMTLNEVQQGVEPKAVQLCPWKTQGVFLERDSELRVWLFCHGTEFAEIKPFVRQSPDH